MRVTIGEIGASKVAGVAIRVVVLAVPRDIIDDNDGREGLLDVVIRGVVQLLGRGNIATCGLSTRDARKNECEDECSEEDHYERAGV